MQATVHLVSGPRGSGKTTAFLHEARRLITGDPGSVLYLAPTRLGLESTCGRFTAFCGLRWATFSSLVESLLAGQLAFREVLSEAQRRLLVEEIATESAARGELRHFGRVAETAGFAEAFLAMAAELTSAAIRPAALARASYRSGDPAPGEVALGKASIRRPDRERARLFARYHRQLARLNVSESQPREEAAARLVGAGESPLLEGVRAVFVDGFSDFTTGQYAVLEALAQRVEAIWVSLLDEEGDDRAELFSRLRNTRSRLAPFNFSERRFPPPVDRPAGLAHLAGQLFRPLRRIELSDDAAGIERIEAPGLVGEVRLVARRIRLLLVEGTPADDLIVVARDLGPYADLLRETFAEYDIPIAIEGSVPLLRQAGVALLLRALRLPEDDFPFAGLTALLRHSHFRPAWLEIDAPEVPLLAEALLRLLGEPRGRDLYLAAVARWAEAPPVGLEDETAEESRRQRTHELARRCRPFIIRLFSAFDAGPQRASLGDHLRWLRGLADDLGIARAVGQNRQDQLAWEEFWRGIDAWEKRVVRSKGDVIDRRTFFRRLTTLALQSSLPRSQEGPGRVRVLSAPTARHLGARILFLLGLGERGFPRPAGTGSLLGDEDRAALIRAGLPLATPDTFADEMLLFTQIVTEARERLILSYPAVDERGQELLPGSFLLAVANCFSPGAIPVERRSMRLEGLERDRPLSAAEYRVRVASAWPLGAGRLRDEVRANLLDASEMGRRRFAEKAFTAHDGLFTDPLLIDWVGKLFGPQRVFSPTALEDYVGCPFRFFLRHVLHLEPLDEPTEEVEVTRRGMTYHRALSRLHQRLRADGVDRPTAAVEAETLHEMRRAVEEDVARAPGPASKALWRLEGERLLRSARRYPGQWAKFVEPWNKLGIEPRPHLFEVDFGLPTADGQPGLPPLTVRGGDVEVRLSGRIDRVDLAPLDDGLGFWIIDYKTGRAGHYTGSDLARFRRLQLTLYACAVESVFLAYGPARPLGLAYWLVSDTGSKVALPGRSIAQWRDDPKRWPAIRAALEQWVITLAQQIRRGAFPLAPRSLDCTLTCPYGPVCRIGSSRSAGKLFDLPLPGGPEAGT